MFILIIKCSQFWKTTITKFDCVWIQTQKSPNDPHIRIRACGCKFHHYQPIPHFKILLDINFYWNRRPLTIYRFCWRPFWKRWHRKNDAKCNFHHYQSIPHFKITLDINFHWNQRTLKFWWFCRWPFSKWRPFARDFFFVRIFYQPSLIYMPSFVEIPLAVSDISEVKDFDICSRFPWQRRPFWKFQDLGAPLEMGIHFPVKFSKDRIISLWEFGRTSSQREEEEE